MKKWKIQGQVTTLEMPFTCNRKSTNFSSTHVHICVKDATPLLCFCQFKSWSLHKKTSCIVKNFEYFIGLTQFQVSWPLGLHSQLLCKFVHIKMNRLFQSHKEKLNLLDLRVQLRKETKLSQSRGISHCWSCSYKALRMLKADTTGLTCTYFLPKEDHMRGKLLFVTLHSS